VGGYAKIGHRVSGDDVLLLQLVKHRTRWKINFANDSNAHNVTSAEKSLSDFINQRIRWASNGPYQIFLDIPFFLYILNVFLANTGIICALAGAISGLLPWHLFLTTWFIKTGLEFIVIAKAAHSFNRFDLLKYFPVWAFLQIPYVVLVGSLSSFGNFTWKDREHGFMKQYLKWGEKRSA
jgi:cellulose synthase/poly-beta-1,6-N-acetylglucosamine synthase-like glycosyltransferase